MSDDRRRLAVLPAEPAVRPEPGPSRGGLRSSFGYAWYGIRHVLRTQRNARIQLAIGSLVLAAAVWLQVSSIELAILALCVVMVLAAEIMNTVVEAAIDLVTVNYHPLAKTAKDAAAGAVLVTSIGSAIVGLAVLGPHVLRLLAH
jgi:diacylglycerol kinase